MDVKKKILFYYIAGASDGGADHSLYYLITNLDLKKYEPHVIYKKESEIVKKIKLTISNTIKIDNIIHDVRDFHNEIDIFWKENKIGKIISQIVIIKPFIRILKSKSIRYSLKILPQVFKICLLIYKEKIDIVHLNHDFKSDKVALIAGIITRRKIICHLRGVVKLSLFDKVIARRVTKFIAISNFIKDEYSGSILNVNNISVIYNGTDMNIFNFRNRDYNKVEYIGFIGRLEKWKGIITLIDSVPLVLKEYPNLKFIIAGNGKLFNYLIERVNNMKITKSISFLGAVDNIVEVYEKIDIFVHTSVTPEPFGRVVIEAMATGLPVISTVIGGPNEIITDRIDGLLIEPGDEEILAGAIIGLVKDKNARKKMGTNAIKSVESKFNIEKSTREIESLYEQIK